MARGARTDGQHHPGIPLLPRPLIGRQAEAAAPAEAPIIKIPLADLSATPLSISYDAGYHNVHYRFRIANNGPARSTFKYHMYAKWTAYGQPDGTQDGGTYTVTKNPGDSFDVDMFCQISGDGHACGGGVVELTPIGIKLREGGGRLVAF